MKKIFTLIFVISACVSALATDYTIGDNQTTSNSNYLPFSIGSGFNDSFTQQLYLASELTAKGASAGNITAITFKYVGASTSTLSNATRSSVEVWIRAVNISSFSSNYGYGPSYSDKSAGTKYFDGSVTLPTTANTTYTITLDDAFEWNGTSNIIVTINDKTNTQTNGFARNHLVYSATNRGLYAAANSTAHNASAAYDIAATRISNVPVITFTFEDTDTPIPAPTSPYVDNETTNSADIHWTVAEGADSYSIRYRASTGSYGDAIDVPGGGSATSYTLSGLEDGITYYYQIRTNVGSDYSDWTDEDSFSTTAIPFSYDEIDFNKWISTANMPTSGNYYLNADVALTSDVTVTGDLKLCLNGNTISTSTNNISVPNGKTLTIYDNVGTGVISGYNESTALSPAGLITVEDGGTLIIKEGIIQNLDVNPNDGYLAYAIYSKGTLRMSGGPVISGHDADICLFSGKYITLDGALTNSSSAKYSVKSAGQTFTYGWSTYMSGEKPSAHFASRKSGYNGICVVDGEAKFVQLLALDESSANAGIGSGTYSGTICVSMTRSLTSSQYNTFCLPFALSNAQLQAAFGSGYDLEEFVEASLDGDQLSLTFNKVTSLTAGKPYLLQPSVDVVNPSFEGVTIGVTAPADQTSDTYISFHGTFAPTELTGGNKNLLFLGAGNELFWPDSDGDLKGFRAYFEVKGGAAKVAKRARIVNKEDSPTSFEKVQSDNVQGTKYIENGQLFILYNGTKYNVQGQVIK